MSNASQQTSTKKSGVGCATTKQRFLGQRSAGFVLPVLRISEEVEPKSKARAEEEKTVDHEEVLPLEGGKKVVRGEFAEPSSDDTGLAAGATSGGAFPLSAHGRISSEVKEAFAETAGHAPEEHGKAIGNFELLSRWRILPFHLFLAQRRLGWLQAMLRHPESSEQTIAAIFGRMEVWTSEWRVELNSLGPLGKLSDDYASPFAAAFVDAIEWYSGISGSESFFEKWQEYGDSVRALILCKPLTAAFLALDADLLTAAFRADASFGEAALHREKRQEGTGCERWECGLLREDGTE